MVCVVRCVGGRRGRTYFFGWIWFQNRMPDHVWKMYGMKLLTEEWLLSVHAAFVSHLGNTNCYHLSLNVLMFPCVRYKGDRSYTFLLFEERIRCSQQDMEE